MWKILQNTLCLISLSFYASLSLAEEAFKTIIRAAYEIKDFKKVYELLQNKNIDPTILVDEKNNLYVIHFLAAIGAIKSLQFMLYDNAARFVKSLELTTKSGYTAHEISRLLLVESKIFQPSFLTQYKIFGLPQFIKEIFSAERWSKNYRSLDETYRFLHQTFEQHEKKDNLWREFEMVIVSNVFAYW